MIVPWMLYASAVSALLAGAAWALEAALRPRRRPTRWAWLAAMLLSIALPAARLARPAPAPAAMAVQAIAPAVASEPVWIAAAPAHPAVPAGKLAPAPVAPARLVGRVEAALLPLWLGGSAALALLLLLGRAQLFRRSRRWRSARVDGERVFLSADTGPAVIGVVRSSIVLPEWVLAMEAGERRLILQHERAHISARDPLVLALGMATVLLTPWNAPLWWMLRRLRLAVETDCDARVLRRQGQVGGYARLLLSLAERSAGAVPAGAPAFAEPRSFLERRIRAMITPRPSRRRGLAAGLLAAALVPLLAFALPSPPPLRPAAAPFVLPMRPVTVRPAAAPVVQPMTLGVPTQGAAGDTVQARYDPTAVEAIAQREYPADMRQRGIEGTVTLRFTIGPDGRARDMESISQSGLEFVEPAKRVVQQISFAPARSASQPVAQSVPWFRVPFRLRPPAPSAPAEPTGEEALLRAAIQRYHPELLREESVREPLVYLVVDERGKVVRRAVDWSGPRHPAPREAMLARFPDLSRQVTEASRAQLRTGIPGGRDVRVYWAVVRQGARPTGPIAWGPYPLAAVSTTPVPVELVLRAVRERYPQVLQRASSEGIWFVGHPDGEVLHTGTGRLPSSGPAARYFPSGGVVTFQEAAEGGATRIYWVTPDRVAPSDPNVISGTVRDAAGNPVAGAVVLFRDRQLGGTTDAEGRFAFRAAEVPAGTHALLARAPAGAPMATREVTFQPGSSATIDFALPAR